MDLHFIKITNYLKAIKANTLKPSVYLPYYLRLNHIKALVMACKKNENYSMLNSFLIHLFLQNLIPINQGTYLYQLIILFKSHYLEPLHSSFKFLYFKTCQLLD